MRKLYNINYSQLMLLLTPVAMRSDTFTSLLMAISKPIEVLNRQFYNHVKHLSTRINAQVCYMQAMLNDEFDFYERRIKVRAANFDHLLLWKQSSNKPIMLEHEEGINFKPFLLWKDSSFGKDSIDFEVVLPNGYWLTSLEEQRLKQLVNNNKIASKKYRIVYG